ncbi:DUF4381 domain-containing protein [Vibrio kyushuensis]|uniref:DUF4381 domain-containing protein n=1 Tax=Vibrio kyushuensis TaxID=2910249 RepID=UPI003D0F5F73
MPEHVAISPISLSWSHHSFPDFVEITTPEQISLMPQTVGWQILFSIIILWLAIGIVRLFLRYWNNSYRRRALREVDDIEQRILTGDWLAIRRLPELLKYTALNAYQRKSIAHLYGTQWELFLDKSLAKQSFHLQCTGLLHSLTYNPSYFLSPEECTKLITLSRSWIMRHPGEL